MTQTPKFSPGFRISTLDVIVLIVGAGVSWWCARIDVWLSFAVLFTVGHFFLFCNIVRMPQKLEFIWTGVFLVLAAGAQLIQTPTWGQTFVFCSVATVILVSLHLKSPSYHGFGWQHINPKLPQWWAENSGPDGIKKTP